MRFLTIPDVAAILKAAYRESHRDHLMLLLSFQHGLRESEVAKLRLEDMRGGYIHVARVKNSLETRQPLMTSENILFNEPKILSMWIEERPQTNEFLFPGRRGNIKPNSVGKIAKHYMQLANIPQGLDHHHSLRHAWASFLLRSGLDLAHVKEALGHASLSSTCLYVHVTQEEVTAKASAAMSSYWKGVP
jgi:site-specific recombinase XerD